MGFENKRGNNSICLTCNCKDGGESKLGGILQIDMLLGEQIRSVLQMTNIMYTLMIGVDVLVDEVPLEHMQYNEHIAQEEDGGEFPTQRSAWQYLYG